MDAQPPKRSATRELALSITVMLQAQEIEVEVAGKTVLEGASFTLQPGDKVGLVGRNGAGKTSLLRALSGETAPVRGRTVIKGALGYLPQDPRLRASVAHVTGVTHIVSGHGLEEEPPLARRHRQVVKDPVGDLHGQRTLVR